MEFVSWDDELPNMMEKIKFMSQTTNQISMFVCVALRLSRILLFDLFKGPFFVCLPHDPFLAEPPNPPNSAGPQRLPAVGTHKWHHV